MKLVIYIYIVETRENREREREREREFHGYIHTLTKQSWKKRRRMEAPILGSLFTA